MSPFTNQPTSTILVHLTSQPNVVHSINWFSSTSDCSLTIIHFALVLLHFHLPKSGTRYHPSFTKEGYLDNHGCSHHGKHIFPFQCQGSMCASIGCT
ncbi:hypothetical protein CROQUDRAFT_309194 [Cronartium quercuum f. sp. fusiforme G11]|uniref:Uncharacterized protein n=1 Tax=Cronartium quercuum f. sp. fusiforme G11 TaxID=708437 RepID=A0A9P6NC98_9BASI|nr:hypothetical protein CROQUDRAFT_309194 [Cronartium quercuum f. sp. fusiforme G11]